MPRSAIIAILLFLPGILFQTAAAQTCDIAVPATIVDAQTGLFVQSITPAMVHAKIGNQFFPITSVERIKSFRVLLLVDSSGSMDADSGFLSHKIRTVKEVRKIFERELVPASRGLQLGFGIFNDRIAFANEFTTDPERFRNLILDTTSRLKKPGYGGTALLDALRDSMAQFSQPQPGDTVLVITDGGDNRSRVSEKELVRQIAQKGIRIFVLLVQGNASNPEEIFGPSLMEELAERTGGAVHQVDAIHAYWDDKKWFVKATEDLDHFWSEQVISAYSLHFSIRSGQQKEQKWILAIEPAANGKRKMAAGYPSHLQTCARNTAAR